MSTTQHKLFNAIGIGFLLAIGVVTVVINSLAGSLGDDIGIFESSVGDLSDMYDTDITPAGFTFSIWSIIYMWLLVCYIFFVITICLTNSYGAKLYVSPEVVTPTYLILTVLNLCFNISWIFLWDRQQLVASSVFLFLIAISNILSLGVLCRNVSFRQNALKSEQPKLYWTYVILAQNGPAIYTTWTVIASLLNLIHALHYVGEADMFTCCMISLSLLLTILVIWFVLENTILDRFVRFIVTPYLVVIWASAGIMSAKGSDPDVPDETKNFVLSILIIGSVMFILRCVLIALKQWKKPLA